MEKSEILQKISVILTEVLKHDRFTLTEELTAADVENWDSLNHMQIIASIEEVFSIKFKLRELNKMKDLGSLVTLVEGKI